MLKINAEILSTHKQPKELIYHIGETVRIHGMIYKIRVMSGFAFVLLQTATGLLQCVWSKEYSEFPLEALCDNMSVVLTGLIVAEERSRSGFEIRLLSCQTLSVPAEQPPVVINNKELKTAFETLLDYRSLTLRNQKQRAIFKIQGGICEAFRNFFAENDFTEIHTPKICSGTAEGGANVFKLDYFGKEAFLAQSPQFYKQAMAGVFERVYEIGPVFRAEKHDTSRHINEYTSVDFEIGFINNFYDIMHLEVQMLSKALEHLREHFGKELTLLETHLPALSEIPAIPFDEAKKQIARTFKREITDFEDFEPEEEKLLCDIIKRQTGSEFVFVTHYRSSKRPFYAMDTPSNPTVTESFDLLFRGMEITTGGQRIHDYHHQVEKMRAREMDVGAFSSYLMAHQYGLPPHGGLGLGLERFTAKLLGFDNVRFAALFPRDINRLEP